MYARWVKPTELEAIRAKMKKLLILTKINSGKKIMKFEE